MKKTLLVALLFGFVNAYAVETKNLPDFKIKVSLDTNAKMPGWILDFTPPSGHHFNTQAPMKVQANSLSFIRAKNTEKRVQFRLSSGALKTGDTGSASLFLCDQAKTYCLSKTEAFTLTVSGKEEVKVSVVGVTKKAKKDRDGFWDNAVDVALADAAKQKKPLMIDFYGIWCPPCNRFVDGVFGTAAFKKAAKNWVLLKLDADQESSFPLKSYFRVGGYPTIVLAKPPESGLGIAALQEIDRITDFYPLQDFLPKLESAYQNRNQSLEERAATLREKHMEALLALIDVKLEQQDHEKALELVNEGLGVRPRDLGLKIIALTLQVEKDPKNLQSKEASELLKIIVEKRDAEYPMTLLRAQDLILSHADDLSQDTVKSSLLLLESLKSRVDKKTLYINGLNVSIADLDSAIRDAAESLKDDILFKTAASEAVKSYEALRAQAKEENARGLNLELAYALFKAKRVDDAKALYQKMIDAYPREFTFYFASARLNLEEKHYELARDLMEKAVQYAYGDNLIRSMERLVRVMALEGQQSFALDRGRTFLKNLKVDSKLQVRTSRYVKALEKTLSEIEKGKIK